ncbi:MAG TPA: phosphatase domain-containing protein [Longimicrobium sp.]|nr:phosphatase domain-containing protein [Longimicrobium sp.]
MADWKASVQKFIHRVEEKVDAQREKYGRTGNGVARIDSYRGYGCADRAYLKGRVLRGNPIPKAEEGHGTLMNIAAMIQRFESDEVAGARVRIHVPGGDVTVTTDKEGYFEAWINPRPEFAANALWHTLQMTLEHPASDPPYQCDAQVLVPPPQSAFGVISDLDDTVVRTGATSLLRMARTTFFSNARTRVPFPGVAAFYRALQKGAGESPFNPIFYVSSSPWNLHDLLTEFLTIQKIPIGPLLLRDWGLNANETLANRHAGHKLAGIRRIMDLFPALPFILIGDSGQEDPEIYHRVVHDYPDRILAVYIRNVKPHPTRIESIRKLGDEVQKAGSVLMLTDDTLAAARDAASKGWITASALGEVAEGAVLEHQRTPSGTGAVNRELSTEPPPPGVASS